MIIVILLTFITAIGLSSILIYINTLLAKKRIQEREKPSAFECGFDPKRSSRLPFSLRFYLIAVIFFNFWCRNHPNYSPTNYYFTNKYYTYYNNNFIFYYHFSSRFIPRMKSRCPTMKIRIVVKNNIWVAFRKYLN